MPYGWLDGGWKGGRSGGGYPRASASDPNVAALWYFDEASGDIVDEVASLTLPDTGTPVYQVAGTGGYAGWRGITLASGSYFGDATAAAGLGLGTSDFVIEFVASLSTATTAFMCMSYDTATHIGYYVAYQTGTNNVQVYLRNNASVATCNFTTTVANDGLSHKWRVAGTRAGNATLYIDGVSYGTQSLAAVAGVAITADDRYMGHSPTGAYPWAGTVLEYRLTVGNATNNSGGPGGG